MLFTPQATGCLVDSVPIEELIEVPVTEPLIDDLTQPVNRNPGASRKVSEREAVLGIQPIPGHGKCDLLQLSLGDSGPGLYQHVRFGH